jgi:PAS domain-containing protein
MEPDRDLLLEHTSDAVIVLDARLTVTQANGKAALLYRRPRAQLLGQRLLELFPELAGSAPERSLGEVLGAQIPSRFEMFVPSLFAWHSVLAVPTGAGLTLFCRDITDRVRKENDEVVRASVRRIVEDLPVSVAITRGPGHRIELLNAMARELFGGTAAEGELLETALPGTRAHAFIELLDGVYRTGRASRGEEMALDWLPAAPQPQGRFFDLVLQPVLDQAGARSGILHLLTDVTEKVSRTALLARYAAERDAVLEQLAQGVILTDAGGRITFVNEAAQRMHGAAVLDVPPEGYSAAYHLLTDAETPHPFEDLPLSKAVRTGETVLGAVWKIRRPDQSILRVTGNAQPVFAADGSLVGGVLTMEPAPAISTAKQAPAAPAGQRP